MPQQADLKQLLLDYSPVLLFSIDQNDAFSAFNRACAESMQAAYGAQVQVGGSLWDCVTDPGAREQLRRCLERARAEGETAETLAWGPAFYRARFVRLEQEGVAVSAEPGGEALLEQMSSAALVIDAQTLGILEANPAACRFYGYNPEEFRQLRIFDLVQLPPEKTQALIEKGLSGQLHKISADHRLASGKSRPVEVYPGPIRYRGRQGVLAVIHPGPERGSPEAERDEVVTRFNTFFQNLPIAAMIWRLGYGPDGAVSELHGEDANEIALSDHGLARADLIGRSAADIFGLETVLPFLAQAQQVRQSSAPRTVEHFFEPNQKHYLSAAFLLAPDLLAVLSLDMTERKRTEAEREVLQNRLANIISAANLGTWEWNVQTGATQFNERWAEIIGYRLSELEPVSIQTWIQYAHPDDLERSDRQLERVFAGQLPEYNLECRMRHKDGGWVWVQDTGRVVEWTPDGKPLRMAGAHVDITARKQAEDELRENERFRLATLNTLQAHIAVLNQAGEIVAVNQAWTDFGADNPPVQSNMGAGANYIAICESVPADSPDAPAAHGAARGIRAVIAGEIPSFEMEYPCDSPGARRWFNLRVTRFPGGGPVYVTVAHEDISQVKLAEEQLRGFFNLVPDLVCIASTDGYFKQLNDEWARCLGYTRAELLARPMAEFMHPADREETFRQVALQLQGQSVLHFVNRYLAKDGSVRWLEWNASPSPDGVTLFAAARDISARVAAEQALRDSEAKFSSLFRFSPVAINIFRASEGRSVDCNEAFVELTGYAREEIIGHSAEELNLFVNPRERQAWMEQLRQGGAIKNISTVIRKKSGATRYTMASMATFQAQGEAHVAVLAVDTTAAKQTEAALLLAQTQLEKRVQERTAELHAANQALEKALQAKDEFMAAMSHELRTPLTGILGLSEALQEQLYGPLNEKQLKSLKNIQMGGQRLLALVNDVIDFARLQAGGVSLDSKPGSLARVCAASVQAVRARAEAKQQQLLCSVDDERLVVEMDERRIKQVLINLLDNAVKFTPAGGKVVLSAQGFAEEGLVRIRVADSGIGIKAEDLPRLFQPFVQLDARLARMYEGTGLGLVLARALVELHQGSVSVESVFGQGSVFTVTLPWSGQDG